MRCQQLLLVEDKDLALILREKRLLTSSLRHEPTFKSREDEDVAGEESTVPTTKKARQVANFNFGDLLPLPLTAEEAYIGCEIGLISVKAKMNSVFRVIPKSPSENAVVSIHDRSKLAVFRHFWVLGYTLVDGLKYGVDYLAYRRDPLKYHAEFMLCLERPGMDWLELTRVCAVSAKSSKLLLIATVDNEGGKVTLTSFERATIKES